MIKGKRTDEWMGSDLANGAHLLSRHTLPSPLCVFVPPPKVFFAPSPPPPPNSNPGDTLLFFK